MFKTLSDLVQLLDSSVVPEFQQFLDRNQDRVLNGNCRLALVVLAEMVSQDWYETRTFEILTF